ncbi:hypothetical protein F511_30499 [Dorcoceras hygrometricum]|uniref:Uncharacterized protein n=1 Tax=Dorcoceras hygrometricum TaxID=472368 RepID=A0A2Z7C8F7_9LAMI|nr:hypothetical protein F511_30499 [Dorcoceras hygrometricum]
MEGFTDLSEVPKDLVFDAQSIFSESEQGLLMRSLTILVDDCYHLWREDQPESLVFDILKDMVTPGSRQAKGYAIQICVLLKNVPSLELGESRAFPSSRILSEKTVHRYVVINEKVGGEEVADAPRVKKTPVKKAASKKRPATNASAEPVVKIKRTTKSKSVSAKETLEILPVAQESVPLQIIEPTPTAPDEQPPVPKLKSHIVGEAVVEVVDDTAEKKVEPVVESVEEQQAETAVGISEAETAVDSVNVETVVESVDESVSLPVVADVLNEGISTTDDVDIIIEQVIAETTQIQTDDGDQDVDTSDVGEKTVEKADEFITEPVEEMETEAVEQSTDEAIISTPRVDEGDWYKASLPKINPEEKGKAPLKFRDPIKCKPPKEIFSLILADIECLVQLREQKLSAQIAAAGLDNVDVRKEVKEINAKVTYLDGQAAAIRSELFDFHEKAEENYLNLSSQLGFLVDYINRGGNDKKGEGNSSRPQPPPDDQSRPSGGNGGSGNRAEEQSRFSGGKSRIEAIGVDLPREDIPAVVLDRSEDRLKIG